MSAHFKTKPSCQLIHAGVCGEDVPLSVFDQEYGMQITRRAYAWNATLDPEALRRSLRLLIRRLPRLAGRLVSGRDGGLRIVCADQGLELMVVEAPGAMPHFDLDDTGSSRLSEWAGGRANAVTGEREPLLRLQITVFAGGGTIVGLAAPHLLADAGTLSRLMHAWSLLHRGEPCPPLCEDRRALIAFEREAAGGLSRSWVQLARAELRSVRFVARVLSRLPRVSSHVFEIDEQDLAPVLEAGAPKLAHDLISAHVWRTLTATDQRPELELTSVLNLRSRLAPLVSRDYVGNAVGHAVCRLTRAELHDRSVAEVAASIRDVRRGLDSESVQAAHAAHCVDWKQGTGLLLRDKTSDQCLRGGVCFNSEVGSPLYDVDFGAGRPVWVVRPDFPIPGFVLWSPSPTVGRYHMRVSLPPDQARWLSSTEGQLMLAPGRARQPKASN
ncbi:acyltransferase [Enhygromyxa salina]|uniref:Acyltransferase PapA5 n=1 Tax=Enhygromyxa salina TaxID=215803 RepID=A0A2S9YN33_9BACT|nr:acyltransferase [Enhygromyxa salina]PRQ06491.1 acyltransferase PapA5 [Enhygromyxa salina]